MVWKLCSARTLSTIIALLACWSARQLHAETIVVYGASGAIGGVIVKEALGRGDTVIGVSRDPAKLKLNDPHFRVVAGDVTDLASFKSVTTGADSVIISVDGAGKDNLPENTTHARAARIAVEAFSGVAKSPYVIQIGGATTMYETKDAMLAHLPFPAEPGSPAYAMIFGHLDALHTYRASSIRWTVLTPPLDIEGWKRDGAPSLNRTGKYRTSASVLVQDASGKSQVNIADLAVAAVDEAHNHRFVGQRFTVGY